MFMSENFQILILRDIVDEFLQKAISVTMSVCFPFFAAIEDLSARFSKRTLDGAKVSLEQMEQTDSIYVENLRPGVNADMLELYFERQAGNAVKDVTMLSGGSAKVSFANCDCKCCNMCDLIYFFSHFLQSATLLSSISCERRPEAAAPDAGLRPCGIAVL